MKLHLINKNKFLHPTIRTNFGNRKEGFSWEWECKFPWQWMGMGMLFFNINIGSKLTCFFPECYRLYIIPIIQTLCYLVIPKTAQARELARIWTLGVLSRWGLFAVTARTDSTVKSAKTVSFYNWHKVPPNPQRAPTKINHVSSWKFNTKLLPFQISKRKRINIRQNKCAIVGHDLKIEIQNNFSGVNNCNPQPCFNGGTCLDKENHFECQCKSGFVGAQCRKSKFRKKIQSSLKIKLEFKMMSDQHWGKIGEIYRVLYLRL